jgi:CRP-like cAMP-binding protein
VSAIAAIGRIARPAPGASVFTASATNVSLYFVTAGSVVVSVVNGDQRVILGSLGAGEVLGGLSILTPAKHACDVAAGEGCELVVIPLADLQALSKQSANLTSQLVFRLMRNFALSARSLGLEKLFH